jgi:hypothetical protein
LNLKVVRSGNSYEMMYPLNPCTHVEIIIEIYKALETQLHCKNVPKRETPRWVPIEVIVLVTNIGWRKCQKW